MKLVIAIGSLVLLLLVGVPIGFGFALSGSVGAAAAGLPAQTIANAPYYAVAAIPLLAIPFFILAGELMNRGKLIDRLVDLADTVFSWLPGRLGHVTTVSSAFLGAMTGSSVATVAAMGSSVGDRMVRAGYDRGYVGALTASSGLLGVLIPPSIPLIVYGAAVGVSVADLFLATLLPGMIMTLAFMVVHALRTRRVLGSEGDAALGEARGGLHAGALNGLGRRLLRALPALVMPVIILGCIYSGLTTATEAAALAGFYALVVIVVGRMLPAKRVPKAFYQAALMSGAILVVIAFTSIFNKVLTLMRVPQDIAEFTTGVTENPVLFLLAVNALLLLVGMFMETNAAVLLMAPLLYPAAVQFGIDPVHFGIILVTNIELGLITPPLAANIFVALKVTKTTLPQVLRHIWPFLLAALAVLMVITFVPELSLWWK
ncbi:TRAP transporter large permease [Microbacterium sp. JB110]|uniref:TRAP transporter large permease n=1 Tax=Microbacterium sp. JB110 TaxID=2024477 RepID=UPI00097F04D7|nr:TRAP transporter large permease [Microbacterium sp. JB110]SJM43758.1 TRAP-type C4-dicarboxylate transport system, large permease component [Frigoribacterium sp. JB110]